MEFEKKGQDFSVIPKEHEVEEYIRGCCCDANVAWNKVDHVLFSIYVDQGKSKLGHWVSGVFTFSDWCTHVYDSQRDSKNEKLVMKILLSYKTLLPYFLEKSKFNAKRGIDKTQSDALLINLVDNLPQQINSDCGVFVAVFTDYFVHGKEIEKDNIDIEIHHTKYGSLLWDYGRKKQKADATSGTKEVTGRWFGRKKRKREEK
ncbi:uncharacterized protein LOC132642679 [Lycium barbarum]|uniref:uncharacterized protein LOC132642679 n=1 Tax=Lycium barbarum TaxID=112863 RepID=UPI00293F3488|nr:uncharacterized protein LOC132642679 [Lycium barbarum]